MTESLLYPDTIQLILSHGNKIRVDSRDIELGDIFVATRCKGSYFYRPEVDIQEAVSHSFDSHPYITDAIARGATCVVLSDKSYMVELHEQHVEFIIVDDGIRFLGEILRSEIERRKQCVIAVTGSTGKSTLSEMLRVVLDPLFTYKHFSDRATPISIPLKALNDPQYYQSSRVVIEMPMDALGQITQLCSITPPSVGVILNINDSHIAQLGSIEAIVRAKMELADNILPSGIMVINIDDSYLCGEIEHLKDRGVKVFTFGYKDNADVRIVDCVYRGGEIITTIEWEDSQYMIISSIPIKKLSYSIAAAFAVGVIEGISPTTVCDRLSGFRPLSGRMSILNGKYGEIILNDTAITTIRSTMDLLSGVLDIGIGKDHRLVLIQGPILRSYQHGSNFTEVIRLMSEFDEVCLFDAEKWLNREQIGYTNVVTFEQLYRWYYRNIHSGDFVIVNASSGVKLGEFVKGLLL